MRANEQRKMARSPAGKARAMPPARTGPPRPTISTVSNVIVSRTGMRRLTCPPGSHMHTLNAESADQMSGGQWKYSFSAMMTATESAARSPSATLSARRFRLADNALSRCDRAGKATDRACQAALAMPRST